MKRMARTVAIVHTPHLIGSLIVPGLPALTMTAISSSDTPPDAAPPSAVATALARRIGQRGGLVLRPGLGVRRGGSFSSKFHRSRLAPR